MRATIIVGEPCTGKSTIMRRVLGLGDFQFRRDQGMARHEWADPLDPIVVFGDYTDATHQFPGCDRLSMGIKPIAMEHASEYGRLGWHVVFEGARLGNGKTITEMMAMGFTVRLGVTLTEHSELSARRFLERNQSERMLKAQGTAIRNMVDRFADQVELLRCDRLEDADRHARWVLHG